MKAIFSTCLIFSLLILISGCEQNPTDKDVIPDVRELTALEKQLTAADNRFGLDIFREIADSQTDSNIFISPLSISMALGMTYNGSGGTTQEAMRQVLHYGNMSETEINASYRSLIELLSSIDPDVQFDIANSIWCREGFAVEQDFLDLNMEYFEALVQSLDFGQPAAADIINAWVEENTNGKIDQIVQAPIDPLTVMFLINAIYFKGSWTYEFDPAETEEKSFRLRDGSERETPTMQYKCTLDYYSDDQLQIVDLPYGNECFSMTVILPADVQRLDSLIRELDNDTWNAWIGSLSAREVNLYLPKFKLRYEEKLKRYLSDLGMEVAFEPGQADFSRINPDEQLFISKVKHKTFVDVNEEGTEAAAVTSVEMKLTSVGNEAYMIVDHPFLFAIRERNSGTILFIGKIEDPVIEG